MQAWSISGNASPGLMVVFTVGLQCISGLVSQPMHIELWPGISGVQHTPIQASHIIVKRQQELTPLQNVLMWQDVPKHPVQPLHAHKYLTLYIVGGILQPCAVHAGL